ncbi:Reverse transcriptase zinc-binding domain [Sesbania bispinosa]|nr:Reverse transcriptase zinc-binding domain [Sesbania bispinosa]
MIDCMNNVCRGITSTWAHVVRGMRWIVGNGKYVNFWHHVWLPCGSKLVDLANALVPHDVLQLIVSEMVVNGDWNHHILQRYLLCNVVQEILMHPVPHDELGDDTPSWSLTPHGSFSTKTAYSLLANGIADRRKQIWDKVWRWEGHQRIRCFMWSILRGELKTNTKCAGCFRGTDSSCQLCGAHAETEIHVLREFLLAEQV